MNDAIQSLSVPRADRRRIGLVDNLARKLVLRMLASLEEGEVTLIDRAGRHVFGRPSADFPLAVTVRIDDLGVYRRLAFGGSNELFEAFMEGRWTCDDLTALVRLFVRNISAMRATDGGFARVATILQSFVSALRRNNRRRARACIAAHYDLGNDFFAEFLDDTMMYSSGIFERADATLREASIAKIDRICRKLELEPDDHLLEIGTGWGGFALHAAAHCGCRITTTTISREQFDLALRRIRDAGLADRVTVVMQDYRDLRGAFDKIVSIEMIEAVGHEYLDAFFRQCGRLLRPGGMMLLQSIVIGDQVYDRARRAPDFIKKYIFPGSCIPSIARMLDCVRRTTDLRLTHLEDFGPHYARTLACWRERFLANRDRIRSLGYGDEFLRAWELYFSYCEGGFAERYIGVNQMLFAKPRCRREPILANLDPSPAARRRVLSACTR